MADYKLPDPGEGLTEAEIVSWKVQVGDTVEINDVVVEIETAKSLVELPSPYEGTVTALLVAEGETVEVGTPIISIGDPADAEQSSAGADAGETGTEDAQDDAGSGEAEMDLSNPAASGSMEGASLVGRIKAERGPMRRARRGSASPSTTAGAHTQMQVQGAFAPGGARSEEVEPDDEPAVPARDQRPEPAGAPAEALVPQAAQTPPADVRALAKPPVRKMAKELGLDLATLTGSGPSGSITRDDVQAASSGAGDDAAMPEQYVDDGPGQLGSPARWNGGERETREPIKGVRKMMAQAMTSSAFTSPHVTEWVTVDVTDGMAFVDRLRTRREFRDVKVSPLLLLARAAMLAMKRTPEINSFWDEQTQEVVYKNYVNLGIAAATPRGLVVPNVKDAESMPLVSLARELNELTETARAGKTQPAQMSEGTFTITNVGVFGVDAGTPIINPGESAILCFGTIRKQPWVVSGPDGDEIVPRQITTLALSFDHRHVDGEKGSRFLSDVAGIIADPGTALLF